MDSKRGVLIAGNWKMNHGRKASADFAAAVKAGWASTLSEKTRDAISARLATISLVIIGHSGG